MKISTTRLKQIIREELFYREFYREGKIEKYDEPTHIRGYTRRDKSGKETYVEPHASEAEVLAREYETEEEEGLELDAEDVEVIEKGKVADDDFEESSGNAESAE